MKIAVQKKFESTKCTDCGRLIKSAEVASWLKSVFFKEILAKPYGPRNLQKGPPCLM